jgi:Reverse transcriptase (RNA-dependent DNA polymerase)/RNase H-like domain found in reverse transcriptase/Integrase zinc binding domain/Chromo (CHRromatin Organisation MOdifier) domain/Retroviral aspartyl protease
VDSLVEYIESSCPPTLRSTAGVEQSEQSKLMHFAMEHLVDSLIEPSISSVDNVLFGFLGSTQAPNKRLLQIPAVISAKHGDAKATVHVLVDTAATHCFLHCNLVSKLGLKVYQFSTPTHAKLGNGNGMILQGYTYVSLQMNDFRDEVKCLVADIGDLGLILGDEWLSYRNVVISYNPKRLSIVSNGKHYRLTGVHDIHKYGLTTLVTDITYTSDPVMDARSFFSHMQCDGFLGEVTLCMVQQTADADGSPLPTASKYEGYSSSFDMEQFNPLKNDHSLPPADTAKKKSDGLPPPPVDSGLIPDHRLKALLEEMRDCFPAELPGVGPTRDYGRAVPTHTIPLEAGSRPVFLPARRYSPKEQDEIKAQITMLLEKKLIQPSHSPYGAPVLFAAKPDGSLRMCIDYRALNKLTVKNKYPIPRIADLLDCLHGAQVFSSLDLLSGYWQIKMGEEDKPKTAFNTPLGHFEWNVLPFGLTNAPATFQSTMNTILAAILGKFALVYLDDILIFSNNAEDHEKHIRIVLDILRKHQFYCKQSKCEFNKAEVKYLGHIVGRHGLKVNPAKVQAVADWPVPTSVTEVQAFLGLANYFHTFIPGHSSMTGPLTDLTKVPQTGKKKNHRSLPIPIDWTAACQTSFDALKFALCNAPTLKLPDFSKPFEVMVDASILGTGAILIQDGQPVAYESHKLSGAEKNYTTGEQEMLAVIRALTIWRVYLEGPQFTVFTDHNPNTYFASMKVLSRRQVRWSEFLSRFNFSWKYIPGPKNISDGLSRIVLQPKDGDSCPNLSCITVFTMMTRGKSRVDQLAHTPMLDVSPPPLDTDMDASAPCNLDEVMHDAEVVSPGLPDLPPLPMPDYGMPHSKTGQGLRTLSDLELQIVAGYTIDDWYQDTTNTSSLIMRDGLWYAHDNTISVPKSVRTLIMEEAHGTVSTGAHLGIAKTIKRIRRYYQWTNLNNDVTVWINGCESCMRSKSHKTKSQGLLCPLPIPSRRFGSISMDFVTCLPLSTHKNDTIYVIIDRLTKYARFIPCKLTISSEGCAKLFHAKWVADICGIPDDIVSDRDGRFTSAFWQQFHQSMGTRLKMSTAFHPQTDGQTERMNRTMEEMLRAYVNPLMSNWEELLPLVQHAYNSSVQASTSYTPYEAAFGVEPRSQLTPSYQPKEPGVIDLHARIKGTIAGVQANMAKAQQRQATFADQHRTSKIFAVGDKVLLSTVNLKIKQPKSKTLTSNKLLPKYMGPFTILECVGKNAYLLQLPLEWKQVHPVVHVSLLQQCSPHSRHRPTPPVVLMEDGSPEWEVHSILDVRVNKHGIPKSYLLAFEGFGPEYNLWEPPSSLENCQTLLEDFWTRRGVVMPTIS